MKFFENLEITNPNKAWVMRKLNSLILEWDEWHEFTKTIRDHDYDPNTMTIRLKDGKDNLDKNDLLIQKTVTFLSNNFKNYNFMWRSGNGSLYEDVYSRLSQTSKQRLLELKALAESLNYAKVPDSYWKQKGKQLVDTIADKTPEVAAEIGTAFLKNPSAF